VLIISSNLSIQLIAREDERDWKIRYGKGTIINEIFFVFVYQLVEGVIQEK